MKLQATSGLAALAGFLLVASDLIDPVMAMRALAIGAVAGIAGGLVAGAIGLVSVPLLTLGLGLSMHAAVATNLFQTVFTAASGALRHHTLGNVDLRLGVPILAGAAIGAPSGVLAGAAMPGSALRRLFVVLLVAMSAWLVARAVRGRRPIRRRNLQVAWLGRPIRGAHRGSAYAVPWAAAALVGLAVGFVAGLLGVGGGFLIAPAAVGILGLPGHLAIGTSLTVIAGNSLFGTIPHLLAGRVVVVAGIFVAMGGVAGASAASHWADRLPERRLDGIFAVLLLAIAWQMA